MTMKCQREIAGSLGKSLKNKDGTTARIGIITRRCNAPSCPFKAPGGIGHIRIPGDTTIVFKGGRDADVQGGLNAAVSDVNTFIGQKCPLNK